MACILGRMRPPSRSRLCIHSDYTIRRLYHTSILPVSPWGTIHNECQHVATTALAPHTMHTMQHNPQQCLPIREPGRSDPVADPFAPHLLLHYPTTNF